MQRAALAALTLAAATGIPDLAILPAKAQETGGVLTTTLSQSLVVDTNYGLDDPSPGTSVFGDTRVVLDYLKQTSTQTLGLGLDTGLRALAEADEDFEFVLASPSTANVDFAQEGPNTSFDAGFRIRSRRVDYIGPLDIDGPLPDDIGGGAEEDSLEYRSDADLGFALGTNSPSTYEFRLAATNFDYNEDTGRDNLVPRRSVVGEATWTLRITPVLSTVAFGSYYYYTADNSTDDEIRVAEGEVGLAYQPSENLRIRGGVGVADREREQTIGGVRDTTEHDTGPTVRGDIRYVLPSLTLLGDARFTTAAPQNRFSGTLRGVYTLPRGQISGRLFQRYGGNQGGSDSRVTGVGLGLTHELTQVSSVVFDASYATQVDEDDPDDPSVDRTDLTASYIHGLTETVSAEIGYGFRHRVEDPNDATSNRFFVVIGKTFETGL
jgi:hypothetical protein